MMRDLLEQQHLFLDYYFKNLSALKAQKVFDALAQCEGLIVFTGVGKSGIIAEKIAATFISTGTKALYLPPTNFLHGDIGILGEKDILVVLSKSGETEELLNLLPFAKRRQTKIIAWVSSAQSRLANMADVAICLPVEKELCPFDLAPTTSTVVQLLFGDAMAVSLMRHKKFSLDEYALNHPSGTIGKKMTLKVEDVMFKGAQIPLCRPTDRVVDVLVELSNKKCGCLLVVDEVQKLLGIFTDGDLRRSLQSQGPQIVEQKIGALMTHSAQTISKNILAWEAIQLMQKDPQKWMMVMPVVEQEKVVGILRMHDIIHAGLSTS